MKNKLHCTVSLTLRKQLCSSWFVVGNQRMRVQSVVIYCQSTRLYDISTISPSSGVANSGVSPKIRGTPENRARFSGHPRKYQKLLHSTLENNTHKASHEIRGAPRNLQARNSSIFFKLWAASYNFPVMAFSARGCQRDVWLTSVPLATPQSSISKTSLR